MFVRALLPPGEKARDSFFSLPLSPPFPLRSLSRAPFHLRFSRGINRLSAAAAARKTFFPMHIIKKKTVVSLECQRSLYFLSADWKSRLISLETNIVTASRQQTPHRNTGAESFAVRGSGGSICILSTDPHRAQKASCPPAQHLSTGS